MAIEKKPEEIIYISDLDGTLLGNDAAISSFSKEVLSKLLKNGLYFTVASARSVISIRKMMGGLRLRLPIIEFNGAFISTLESGHHQVVNNLDPAIAEEAYRLIKDFGLTPFISTFNGTQDCLYYSSITNGGMQWYLNDRLSHHDERLRSIENLVQAFHDKVVCLNVIGSQNNLYELEFAIKEQFSNSVEMHLMENQYSQGWYWLTIHDYRATKDQAIRLLLEEWRLDKWELVVFGDNDNDIKMFQLANRAIAVANATDKLKHYATQIIGSNSDDSVVKFIQDDFEARHFNK